MADHSQPDTAALERNPSAIYRSAEREMSATYRMTRDEKQRLRHEAEAMGLTSQQLFELRMFGQAKPVRQYGRPASKRHKLQEELPLTRAS